MQTLLLDKVCMLNVTKVQLMVIKEKFAKIVDRIVLARARANHPDLRMMWDHKLRVFFKETLGSRE